MTKVRLDLRALVNFYDADHLAGTHSNAIKTLAGEELGFCLMKHYFASLGKTARRLEGACTTGKREQGGYWLDGWFEVVDKNDVDFYQVEIKSWSFHGYGPKESALPVDCDPSALSAFQEASWQRYWKNGRFISKNLQKVLEPMKIPPKHGGIKDQKPLACLWSPMHPKGKLEAFFSVPTAADCKFSAVWVFSMSTYARMILPQQPSIEIEMPLAHERIRHLNQIFT